MAALVLGAGAVSVLGRPSVGVFLLVCALAAALFFRDPKREALHSPTHVVCPADGRVVSISEVTEDAYLQARSKRISIFMSILNVHVNFSPIGGHVEYLRYRKGTFHRANLPEASLNNENNSIGIHAGGHRVLVRQIAGTIARRIVCRVKVNDPVHPGQKIGLIQFGSRVDLFIPPDWEVLVKEGERVKGAISQIARIT